MKLINVGAAALNQTPLDWDGNLKNIINAIRDAHDLGVNILCLPELCITGYGCEDFFFAEHVQKNAINSLLELIKIVPHGMIVSVGLPLVFGNCLYNVAALVTKDVIFGFVPKKHLCSDGIHYESRWFKPWKSGENFIDIEGYDCSCPIGGFVFECNFVRIGFEICEDAWVADRPGVKLAERGVDIILNPSASHFSFGKHEIRKRFITEGSRAFKAVYVYSNLLGNESGRTIFDGDVMIASEGRIVAQSRRLSFLNYTVTAATVNITSNRTAQLQNGSFRPDTNIVPVFCLVDIDSKSNIDLEPNEQYGIGDGASKEIEFKHAVSLGLYDYMRKTKSNGFVVSLSGGADSSAVSCLVRSMYDIARSELGVLRDFKDVLTCVYQKTVNSSNETLEAAQVLASSIGAELKILDVNNIVNEYTSLVSSAVGRELTWEEDDLALQNIQARVRSPGVWMIANIKNALLLCTSNRSEAAVGYFTMDGDSCGGLAPIAGIDKSYLLEWLDWLASRASNDVIMYNNGLRPVLALLPTAELRPKEANQFDEDDLMPYPVLNKIEGMAIRDKMSPEDIKKIMSAEYEYSSVETKLVHEWVDKFFKLFSRAQWKRDKLPLAFHLDDHSLDPKSWCRFPVLNGGL